MISIISSVSIISIIIISSSSSIIIFSSIIVSITINRVIRISNITIISTVSFHNFKSQDFKLSVSNPKNIYVSYLYVLSRISKCQSLGRKNKHKILKTDRSRPPTASPKTPSSTSRRSATSPSSAHV